MIIGPAGGWLLHAAPFTKTTMKSNGLGAKRVGAERESAQ